MQYDIAVIGNDEAAIETLCLAARSRKRVAAILPETSQSAWFTGLALRRLVSDLLVDRSETRQQLFAEVGSPRLLKSLLTGALVQETMELVELLEHLGVDVRFGQPRFVDRNTIDMADGRIREPSVLTADAIVVGTGIHFTALHRPLGRIAESGPEALFGATELPETLCVLGGESVGAGIAALYSLFGVRVSHVVVDEDNTAMLELAKAARVTVRESNSAFSSDGEDVVDLRRAVGFTEQLNLSAIDVEADENGQLWCARGFETWCSGVYGVGDVVGFSPDSELHPSIQAERVMRRVLRSVPQPHLFDALASAEEWDDAPVLSLCTGV